MNLESSSQSPSIFVVDDDTDFMEAVEHSLYDNGLTNVHCCQDSRMVMPMLEKEQYSLILLDLKMSPISGLELLPKIVKNYPETPVIVLSALSEEETVVNCMKYGAFEYLVKPIDTSRLLKAISDSMNFINLEGDYKILRELDFSNENDASVYSTALLKIDFLLVTGKAKLVIPKVAPIIENKKINMGNVGLFYALGQAYEKVEDFGKALNLYQCIAKFDPLYPGIQEKLEKIKILTNEIIKIYHKERYDKMENVGKGAIGVVYKAKDTTLDRIVALKILNQSPSMEKRDIERFISEAKKVAQLPHHANIVGVYDCGQIENDYFISMEFIEGMHLGALINNKHPIPIPDTLVIAKKLFTALDHSHRNGVIHRDIKPKNIMISYENEVKVVDFGIAILKGELNRENRNVIYGTPFYMSPEQFDDSITDHLSDIYSAGVTLFHLVTGIVPFQGSSYLEIKDKHLTEKVPSIKKFRDGIPKGLIEIIEKCMRKKKNERYQSARQVVKKIEGIGVGKGKTIITSQTKLRIFDSTDVMMTTAEEGLHKTTNSKDSGYLDATIPTKVNK